MSATDNQPENKNFLSPLGFKFSIKRTPHVNWFLQTIQIPGISLARTDVSNPFSKFPVGGDHLEYGNIGITFRIDEDMANYLELYNWINAIGFPDNFDQYKEVAPVNRRGLGGTASTARGEGLYSDGSLTILSSAKNANISIQIYDMFPIALSQLDFNTQLTNVNYLVGSATFACRRFQVSKL